jgi:lysozyme
MARAGELDLEGLAPILGLLLVGYVLLNYYRDAEATGGASFPGTAPGDPLLDEGLDILDPMQVSPAGVAAIQKREGPPALTPKPDAGNEVIGYGHTIQPGENYSAGINKIQSFSLLQTDLAQTASVINGALMQPVTQNQFDALASLEYDIGAKAFRNSTVVKNINAGNYSGAAQAFALFNKSQGSVNSGLVARRTDEQQQFNS